LAGEAWVMLAVGIGPMDRETMRSSGTLSHSRRLMKYVAVVDRAKHRQNEFKSSH
jgi:hypothetical protein